jgi:hypothetical protein
MDKILEDYLWSQIGDPSNKEAWGKTNRSPREVIKEMVENDWIKSPKQAYATLDKWARKGKYTWGSRFDLGWKIDKT